SSPLHFLPGLRTLVGLAGADPEPAFIGGHFREGHPSEQRGRGGGVLMRAYWALVRRELGAHFFSWAGYVVIAVVLFLLGLSSVDLLQRLNGEAIDQPLTGVFYSTWYLWLILMLAT